ncbi:MAG TPA: serine hydrolase domain-containing protein [Fimbriimonadaceae bacterium]|nr:serine hydrolase domain-containing protein [Fimbriimonadaceae bacterium]
MRALPVLLLLSCALTAKADKVDDLVLKEMAAAKVPGISLAVIRDGKPIKVKGYGMANLEHQVRVKPETVFQSGSVGKQFTSALILILQQEGKLSIDDPVVKHFPEAKEKWEGVTIRHLLSHTSGLPDMPYHTMNMREDYTEDQLLKFLIDQKVPEKPGEKWRYNNGGYVLLRILAGRVGGKFYGDLLQEKIFGPLGMTTARIIDESAVIPNRAAGYMFHEGKLLNQPWVAPKLNTTADGSLYMTALDMVKWDAALWGEKLLSKASKDAMWTAGKLTSGAPVGGVKNEYGFGWMISKVNDHPVIHHGGAWQGFTSWIGRYPGKKTSVVIFGNLAGVPVEKIGLQVMQHYCPELKTSKG